MTKAYEQAIHSRILAQGQLVLRAVEHVRWNILGPSKFTLKWWGPYVVKEAHDSGYYYLARMDGTFLVDPINGKWLKQYYTWISKYLFHPFVIIHFVKYFYLVLFVIFLFCSASHDILYPVKYF